MECAGHLEQLAKTEQVIGLDPMISEVVEIYAHTVRAIQARLQSET